MALYHLLPHQPKLVWIPRSDIKEWSDINDLFIDSSHLFWSEVSMTPCPNKFQILIRVSQKWHVSALTISFVRKTTAAYDCDVNVQSLVFLTLPLDKLGDFW